MPTKKFVTNRVLFTVLFLTTLIAFVTTALPVQAGTGSFANGLWGSTWFSSYSSGGYIIYDGNGTTWRSSSSYYLSVYVTTYNNCDYYHQISSGTNWGNSIAAISVGGVTAGTTQCPSDIFASGDHRLQLYPGGSMTIGGTFEQRYIN